MDQKHRDWLIIGLAIVIVLFFLWKGVSTFASATFSPEMSEEEAARLFKETSNKINDEIGAKLNEALAKNDLAATKDRKSTRLNSSHVSESRMPSSA